MANARNTVTSSAHEVRVDRAGKVRLVKVEDRLTINLVDFTFTFDGMRSGPNRLASEPVEGGRLYVGFMPKTTTWGVSR